MRLRPAILVAAGLLTLMSHLLSNDAPAHGRRVLVISTPSKTDARFLKQRSLLTPRSEPFLERDLVVKVRPGEFMVALIGKDGRVAFYSHEPMTQGEIFARIDVMPMRRDEMRRQKAKRKVD